MEEKKKSRDGNNRDRKESKLNLDLTIRMRDGRKQTKKMKYKHKVIKDKNMILESKL